MSEVVGEKALVLCSGGLDSTTLLAMAVERYGAENVFALSISYGQKHVREIEASRAVTEFYGVEQRFLDLAAIFADSNCSLLAQSSEAVPHGTYAEQQAATRRGDTGEESDAGLGEAAADVGSGAGCEDVPTGSEGTMQQEGGSPVSTYVPFRNGLFLSSAASMALSLGCSVVLYGAHHDDWAGDAYPDCSQAFVGAMGAAIAEGTGGQLRLEAPFVQMTKADIVREGLRLKVPYQLTWSCYEGGEEPCHACATCIDRERAFEANGLVDPLFQPCLTR